MFFMDLSLTTDHHERNCNDVMPGMSDFDIRSINLNLLPALEALLETRNVSAAARRAHVSQSAMSHSLAKLRALLGDPLLVPAGRTLVLTPRAARLGDALPAALDQLGHTLQPAKPFSPSDTRRTFRITTLDYFEFAVLGDFLAYFRAHAPHAQLWIERFGPTSAASLALGEIDLALVGETSLARSPALQRAELFRDPFRVMLRPGHPAAKKRALSLEAYLAHPHVVVTVEGRADGAVDRALEQHGARRDVALRVPHFSTAPLAVLQSDAICTIASSVAERARSLYGMVLREPPIALPAPSIVAVWSKRVDGDDGNRWLRELFIAGTATSKHVRGLMRAR
jgi:DNA-binding transcriptional LysR family regulator